MLERHGRLRGSRRIYCSRVRSNNVTKAKWLRQNAHYERVHNREELVIFEEKCGDLTLLLVNTNALATHADVVIHRIRENR